MTAPLVAVPLLGMPGIWELIIILLVVMLLFGATKLPKLGRGLGSGIRNFKEGLKGDGKDDEAEGADEDEASKGSAGVEKQES